MPLILWTDRAHEGLYLVSEREGTVVLGPFHSLPDAPLVAQRLADTTKRLVFQQRFGASPLDGRLYEPSGDRAAAASRKAEAIELDRTWLEQVQASVAAIQDQVITGKRVLDPSHEFLRSRVLVAGHE